MPQSQQVVFGLDLMHVKQASKPRCVVCGEGLN